LLSFLDEPKFIYKKNKILKNIIFVQKGIERTLFGRTNHPAFGADANVLKRHSSLKEKYPSKDQGGKS
jgi:hypothetical protein